VNEKKATPYLTHLRAMQHRSIATIGVSNCLYNFGFFALLAYAPLALGLTPLTIGGIFLGWGVLLALTSYFMSPKLKVKFGATKSLYALLSVFIVSFL